MRHTRNDCIRTTDYGIEVDCNCPSSCKVCFPKPKPIKKSEKE